MNLFRLKYPILYLLLMVMALSCKNELPVLPGVDSQLAQERKTNLKEVHYDLSFDIPENKEEDIPGSIAIDFDLADDSRDLLLDFKENQDHLKKVMVNSEELVNSITEEHIILPARLLKKGPNKIRIEFTAGNLSLNRNEEYLYTLLVPARARTVFPVFDQPDIKATYKLTLSIPESWEAVANGPIESENVENGRKMLSYGTTKPISTYLFAFAVGKFNKWKDEGTGMTMYFRETDSVKVARNAPEIFRLHQSSIEWLEEYTGIPYPFQKFDFALIPTFQYGGMEHPGSIFYRERSLMLDESASVNQKLSRASLIAHETAHMWFGDLVTMKWFDDVWLKEVFANFMAAKIVNPSFPEVNHDLRFLLAHYPRAYGVDRTDGSHPIQQQLPNLEDAGSVYGAIIYQKAPIVMRNLETFIGEEKFREGMKTYLSTYSYNNATWDDLISIMAGLTDLDLNQWNNDWVKKGRMPVIQSSTKDNMLYASINNKDGGREWPQSITYEIVNGGQKTTLSATMNALNEGLALPFTPDHLLPNVDGRMYGYYILDDDQKGFMLSTIDTTADHVTRASMWMSLWESFLNNNLDQSKLFDKLQSQILLESNPLILSYLTGILQSLYWDFMDADERAPIAGSMEANIYERMTSTENISIQRTMFQLYNSIAISVEGVERLKTIWNKTNTELTLPLSERDYENISYQLALRLPEEADVILAEQLEELENPDSKERMKFIIPSLSADQLVRDDFFDSLKDAENRAVEPWVNQALSFLHHPLRAENAIPYIYPSLEMIEEIQQTGDIFFPKGWLDSTLGGHHSPEAAEQVRTYLSNNPDLPDHLKNKILQSADMLFRASLKN